MNITEAKEILADFGVYLQETPAVHMDFEENLPHSKLNIAHAIWEVLDDSYSAEENNSEEFRNQLYFAFTQLLKCYPKPDSYFTAIEYQKNLGLKE